MFGVSGFSMPGYNTPDAAPVPEASNQKAAEYKIPPVAWMLLFLVLGYLGLRFVLED